MRKIIKKVSIILYTVLNFTVYKICAQKPNIIIIMADDMGINDASFRGSNQILTPNIDALAYHGVILDRYYVPALCTPSRAALLTGKHPIHTGMQHYVIPSDEPWGLPLNFTVMPEIFRDAGYSTNLIGKWHLGFYEKNYTPTKRGFDYHFGYYGGYIDYYDHSLIMLDKNYSRGYDMRKNLNISYETNGTYATDLFNEEAIRIIKDQDTSKPLLLLVNHLAPHAGNDDKPMQAPDDEIEKQSHISNINRRQYAAMISKLDEGVGKIIEALDQKKILNNSIVIFYSDNGAPTIGTHWNTGSNYPLRGQKESPWEGGIRTIGLIWSPLIKKRQRIFHQPMYSTDWLPTLATIAGISLDPNLKLDGQNIWDQLSLGKEYKNRRILHNIDEIVGYSAYMNGPWKYVNGTTENGIYDGWLGEIDNETDPKSVNYTEEILNSVVSRLIQKLSNISTRLTAEKIKSLRKNATIICPKIFDENTMNENSTLYHCDPLQSPCLFNIETDPCEYFNLASIYPNILNMLKSEVEYLRKTAIPSARKPLDPRCDPALHNFTWTWWWQNDYNNSDGNYSSNNIENKIFIIIIVAISILICSVVILYLYRHKISYRIKLNKI